MNVIDSNSANKLLSLDVSLLAGALSPLDIWDTRDSRNLWAFELSLLPPPQRDLFSRPEVAACFHMVDLALRARIRI